MVADSGLLCLVNWLSQPEIFPWKYFAPNRQSTFTADRTFCFVVPPLSKQNKVFWGKKKKKDWFALTWLRTVAAALAMNDISALQGSARLSQRWPQFSLEGQFLPTVLVQIYGPRTLKSAKLMSVFLSLLRALWGQFSHKITEKTDRRKWLAKTNTPETLQFFTASAGWYQQWKDNKGNYSLWRENLKTPAYDSPGANYPASISHWCGELSLDHAGRSWKILIKFCLNHASCHSPF